jgi:hypothetical protein
MGLATHELPNFNNIWQLRLIKEGPDTSGTTHPKVFPQIRIGHSPRDVARSREMIFTRHLAFSYCEFWNSQIVINKTLMLIT